MWNGQLLDILVLKHDLSKQSVVEKFKQYLPKKYLRKRVLVNKILQTKNG